MLNLLSTLKNFIRNLFFRDQASGLSLKGSVSQKLGTITRQYRMNYFDPAENSNKVWIGIAYSDGSFETQFGRVRDGSNLACKKKKFTTQSAAENELERKRREKLRKGYKDTVVVDNAVIATVSGSKKTRLSQVAAEEIDGGGDSATRDLIKYLAEVNIHHITHSTSIKYNTRTGAFSTPLGVLTPDAISTARDLLSELKRLDGLKRRQHKKRAEVIREYFQLVPKDFGVKIPPVEMLIASDEQFQDEVSILDALESAIAINDQDDSAKKRLFECRLTKVPHYTDEGRAAFKKTRDLYFRTRNVKHHPAAALLRMTRLYEVEVGEMKRRFDATASRLGNVRDDLWHGTRASNLLSILKNGLVIPPANAAHCTGRMFGNGVYTSLQSTKALNYATDFWNRSGKQNQRTFMFLCEAALGKVHKPKTFAGGYPARGTNSTWVEPGKSGVLNHECIVYDSSQVNLRYLVEFGAKNS
jgi:poly [ADP-ribose] polymerase